MAATVAIADAPGLSAADRLSAALRHSGFRRALTAGCRRARVPAAGLRILIKPDLTGFSASSPAATDPRLVELLIDYLHDAGYRQVAVAGTADSSSVWAENRGVLALADLTGYRFTTDAGRAYDVIDLSEDLRPADFPAGALLAGSSLAAP